MRVERRREVGMKKVEWNASVNRVGWGLEELASGLSSQMSEGDVEGSRFTEWAKA